MPYRKMARVDELPEGALVEVMQGDRAYALCNVDGDIRAMSGVCPHHGGPLGQGALAAGIVTCPWHAFEFDSGTGECLFSPGLKVPTYPVRVEGGDIFVDLPEDA